MNIEIRITAESAEEARAALAQLVGERPATHITVIPNDPRIENGELTIPAGTDLTIAEVKRDSVTLTSDPRVEPMKAPEPEKPRRSRKTKQPELEKPAESPQEPTGGAEAPQAVTTPTEPEKPADHPAAADIAAEAKATPTLDEIARAGAALLDEDSNKMEPLLGILRDFGVQAVTQLKDDQLAAFAERLRALGAEV